MPDPTYEELSAELDRLRRELATMTEVARGNKTHVQAVIQMLEDMPEARLLEFPWIELLRRVTASEREYRRKEQKAWNEHDYTAAIRFRALADGLEVARDHHAHVIADAKRAAGSSSPDSVVTQPAEQDQEINR